MSGTPPVGLTSSALREALADAQIAARDQISQVWHSQVERLQQQLQNAWSEQVEHIVDQRLAGLAALAGAEFAKTVDRRVIEERDNLRPHLRAEARRELTAQLNQAARRMAQSASAVEWSSALLDSTRDFCDRAALFSVVGETMRCENVSAPLASRARELVGQSVALAAAPAFASVAGGNDPLVVIRSAGELGEVVAAALEASGEGRAYLFPLLNRQHVLAVLYAESAAGPVDVDGLELLASIGSRTLESMVREKPSGGLVTIAEAEPASGEQASVPALPREEQELHARAQRFARVQVAEMRLYKSGAVKAGRAEENLYDALRQDIDSSREAFYRQFIATCPSMVDYFHLELVRTLANADASLLGPSYPGPLV